MRLCLGGHRGKVALLVVVAAVLALLFLCHENTRERRQPPQQRFRKEAKKKSDICPPSRSISLSGLKCQAKKKRYTCGIFVPPTTTETTTSQPTTIPADKLEHFIQSKNNTDLKKKMKAIAHYFSDSSSLRERILNEKDPVKKKGTALRMQKTSLDITDMALSNHHSISTKNRTNLLSNVLDTFESLGPTLATVLDAGEERRVQKPNLEMITSKVDLSSPQKEVHLAFTNISFSLPRESLKRFANGSGTVAISSLVFKKMGNFLLNLLGHGNGRETKAEQLVINSDMLMISMGSEQGRISLSENFSMTFRLMRQTGLGNPKCYSFHPGNSVPSKEGCTGRQLNATHVQCTCNHLTSYSVLMSVERSSVTEQDKTLDVLTKISLAVSVLFLTLAFLTFVSFSNLSSERNTVHIHLTASLALAQLLYLFGIDKVDNKLACAVVAGFLHFLFLSVFCWMAIEGLELYLKLIVIFSSKRSIIPLFVAAGYGIPVIIVAVSAGVHKQGYGTPDMCWLSTDKGFHFSFIGPVVAIVLWNAAMLTIAIVIMCRHMRSPTSDLTKIQKMKSQLKGIATLVCLLGVTWLFGLFTFGETASQVFGYLFILMNGTQGIFIFFFHCFYNEKVLKEYRLRVRDNRFIPEGLRRLCFQLIRTESGQNFSRSTDVTSQYRSTLSQFRKGKGYPCSTSRKDSKYKISVVAPPPPPPPPPPKARSPYSNDYRWGNQPILNFSAVAAKKQISFDNKQSLSTEGKTGTSGSDSKGAASSELIHFHTKDVVVPETTETMILESGVYLGESKVTEAMVRDSGVYQGEEKTPSHKAGVSVDANNASTPQSTPTASLKVEKNRSSSADDTEPPERSPIFDVIKMTLNCTSQKTEDSPVEDSAKNAEAKTDAQN